MRKKVLISLFTLVTVFSLISVLNIKVSSKFGKDYQVSTLKIPLYLKVLSFYNRHFNYKWLAKEITGHLKTKEEKIFQLFQWTHETIIPQPEQLPVMDDHVWNVYIRGYGVSDNYHDLFSTLCNYVGVDSFFKSLSNMKNSLSNNFTFTKTARGWVVFDPRNGVYFNNKSGNFATISDIRMQNWEIMYLGNTKIPKSFYQPFMENLPTIRDIGLGRANTQSPINRLKLQLTKWIYGEAPLFE